MINFTWLLSEKITFYFLKYLLGPSHLLLVMPDIRAFWLLIVRNPVQPDLHGCRREKFKVKKLKNARKLVPVLYGSNCKLILKMLIKFGLAPWFFSSNFCELQKTLDNVIFTKLFKLDPDPHLKSGSALRKTTGSGSAKNEWMRIHSPGSNH